jgi:hypothetical protein
VCLENDVPGGWCRLALDVDLGTCGLLFPSCRQLSFVAGISNPVASMARVESVCC